MEHIFLPALLIVAGISLFAGLSHVIAWSRGAPDARTHGWFGLVALLAGIYTIASWAGYTAASAEELVAARRFAIGTALLALPCFVFFAIRYGRWEPRRIALAVWTLPLLLFVANLFLPNTVAYLDAPSLRHTTLGDGTVVSTIVADPTWAAAFVWAPVYVFVLLSAVRLWRAGDRERAAPLGVGTSLMIVAAVNDSLVPRGVTGAYLSEFAFLGLVGLMSVRLSEELVHAAALERLLSSSEQRLRLTLDSIAEAVIVVDSNDRVTTMNPAAVKLTGHTIPQAAGRGIEEILQLPPGREVVASSSAIIDHGGRAAGAVVVLRDVTRERELERRIRETHTMRAVGETAGSIAHEYKNLLGIVLGHAELLSETLAPENREALDSMRAIEEAAQRALELSRRALSLSPARDTPLTVVALHDVVRTALRMIGDTLGPRIRIEATLRSPIDTVPGDPEELRSAIVNLAVNARDAMPDGGVLRITSELAQVTGDEIVAQAFDLVPGTFLRLRVSDTGTGIPEAVRERIFEPYFTTKPRGVGTGLGLAAVYSAVTEPGGAVEVESDVGSGTTFTLWLPILEAVEA